MRNSMFCLAVMFVNLAIQLYAPTVRWCNVINRLLKLSIKEPNSPFLIHAMLKPSNGLFASQSGMNSYNRTHWP